ncbi:protein-tyrosine phosphatase-like protein [Sporodiniella umbellata]|nr:protein-tyrosine phosphatase-like protein [Sporodiniella umbellata]
MGVGEMYKQFAIYCQHEIKSILHIFEDPEHYPIQIHCTQGKDRTGIVSALLLSIAGVPKDLIVQDYAKTRKGLAPVYTGMLRDIRQSGLTDDFAHTTPEDMKEWLDFLDQSYGSVENYLHTIGIKKDQQKRIRENLSNKNQIPLATK